MLHSCFCTVCTAAALLHHLMLVAPIATAGRGSFTVHGLWPNYLDGGWPQFCDHGDHLDPDQVADLLPEMRAEWPSFSTNDLEFWGHEWSKHGTCSSPVITSQHQYFQTALKLHRKYDIEVSHPAAP